MHFCSFDFNRLAILFDQPANAPSIQLTRAFSTTSGVTLVPNGVFATFAVIMLVPYYIW